MFDTSLPDEIILHICRYLSWFDIITAFYNLNSRLNQTISQYLQNVRVGDDCYLKQFRHACSFLLDYHLCLFSRIQTLTISNRGSPLAAKYFLSHIPIQNMIYLEKLTLIELTAKEIVSYLDVIGQADENIFQYLITLHIFDPQYINNDMHSIQKTLEDQIEYESIIINRILTGNKLRLKSILINGDDIYM